MKEKQKKDHPLMDWALLLNALLLLARNLWPTLFPAQAGDFLQGAVLGLLAVGLVMSDPRRAARLRAWKAAHFHR